MDKQLNLIHTIEGLEYVYSADVSPDETKLLLISTGNKFYVVDLRTFEKTRITVRSPYNRNLEGRGCWSFDGKSAWICVVRSTGNSTLRRYCLQDFSKYEDYLPDKYCLDSIARIGMSGTYFLIGYNRKENNRSYFIYFDGTSFQEFPLEAFGDMVGPTATVDPEKGVVTVASLSVCRQFTLDGKTIKTISHPAPHDKKLCASGVFMHLFDGDTEKQNRLKEISASLGMEDITAPDYITKHQPSSCGRYLYLASQSGFYLLNADTGDVLATVPERFGVQNFEELAPGLIAIATWSGVKVFKLCDR